MEARRGGSVKASRGRERQREGDVEAEEGPRKDAAVSVSVTSCDDNNCRRVLLCELRLYINARVEGLVF